MPLLTIQTNIAIDEAGQENLIRQASSLVSEQLSKSEKYVMVNLQDKQPMLFAGTDGPCALLGLKSIGLPEDRTTEISNALCALVAAETDIKPDRVYIEFTNAERHMWGWNSSTF
ncbi:MAG: phenylpyruvate tautomerase MIF-related protein [Acidiferrobacterales bacterium]|nr:phenylpyruvate tautomerase MIF-related protein [Acidiferrobacterales bacterium]